MIYDVAIVGAGPAGTLVAAEVARRGRKVVLVDRAHFPRPKVCGCCLNGRALAAFAAAGLAELPQRLGAVPLHSVQLAAGQHAARVPLTCGVSLSRMAMDVALIQHAQACGVTFLPGCAARLEPGQGNTRTLIAGEQRIESAVVIAADGLGGTLAGPTTAETGSRIGAGVVLPAPAFYQPGIIYMTTGPGGYLGLVLLEDGQLDLACALDREATRRAGGPAALAAALLQRAGWPVPERMETAAWRGTPPLTRAPRSVSGHRLFVVGDASGYVEPFTGEGMAWALSSAVALAPLAAQNWTPRLAQQWIQLHRHVVVHRQLPCRTLAAVLRRPWLMNWLVRMLKVWPALASPLTHTLNRSPLEV